MCLAHQIIISRPKLEADVLRKCLVDSERWIIYFLCISREMFTSDVLYSGLLNEAGQEEKIMWKGQWRPFTDRMAFELLRILMVWPGLLNSELFIGIWASWEFRKFVLPLKKNMAMHHQHPLHVLAEQWICKHFCMHVYLLIIRQRENNTTDYGLKQRNQCTISYHAGGNYAHK